jgi:hypothetical protein
MVKRLVCLGLTVIYMLLSGCASNTDTSTDYPQNDAYCRYHTYSGVYRCHDNPNGPYYSYAYRSYPRRYWA